MVAGLGGCDAGGGGGLFGWSMTSLSPWLSSDKLVRESLFLSLHFCLYSVLISLCCGLVIIFCCFRWVFTGSRSNSSRLILLLSLLESFLLFFSGRIVLCLWEKRLI